MNELFDNQLLELSIIKKESINESFTDSFILPNNKFFSSNISNNRMTNGGENKKRKSIQSININKPVINYKYYQTTHGHKKTNSTKVCPAQQYSSCIRTKMKLFSPTSQKKILPIKELFPKQKHYDSHYYSLKNDLQTPQKIKEISHYIQAKQNTTLSAIQQEFVCKLDVLYIDNIKKIKEVNEKYNYDLYKSLSDTNNTSSCNEKYNQLLSEKSSELSEIENEFLIKKNTLLLKFNTKMCSIRDDILEQINAQRNNIKNEIVLSVNTKLNPAREVLKIKQFSTCRSAKKTVPSFKRTWKI